MIKRELRFDEGTDNVMIADYDMPYKNGPLLTAHPLPVTGERKTVSLDGPWHFSPDVFHSTVRARWFEEVKTNRNGLPIPFDYSFDEWNTIQVPGCWNDQKPEYALYEGPATYFRTFSYELAEKKRLFLRIGAANYETRIWLNGVYLGRHLGGFTPFAVEITEQIKPGENRLLVLVDDTRNNEQVPAGHYDWFNYGGIHRSVELVEVPQGYISDFQVQLSKEKLGYLEYHVIVEAESAEEAVQAELRIPELGIQENLTCHKRKEGHYEGRGLLEIQEETLKLWNLEHPYLYQVEMQYQEDVVRENVGFRRIKTQGREIFLNGEPIFLKGMCVHEESPKHRRAVTEADMEETIKTAKSLGCNFLRLTHYPHNENMAKLADCLGILLWEEIPVYWVLQFENPHTIQDAQNQLTELILRDWNRASVIIWSVGNENPDTDARYHFMSDLASLARNLDSTRLVAASCLIDMTELRIKDRLLEQLDVAGINEYYGWYLKDFESLETILNQYDGTKPIIITETGAEASGGKHGTKEEIYTEECQAEILRKQFETLFQYPFIRGITPWILYDYASMRRMNFMQKGYNLKGVITADRKHEKLACGIIRNAYQKI